MIDKNKLFNLFSDDNPKDEANKKDLIKLAKKIEIDIILPINKLGMFVKLIINHLVFHQKLKMFLEKENSQVLDFEETKEAASFAVYSRAWYYIKGIDLKNKEHCKAVMDYKSGPLVQTLEEAILYFEETEEYEKCAFLHNIKQLKKKS